MSTYNLSYNWLYNGIGLCYENSWNREALDYYRSLRHDVRGGSNYWYYAQNDPYESYLVEFLESLISYGRSYQDLDSSKQQLEFLLTFVQHLKYY